MITLHPRKLTRALMLVVLVVGVINLGEGLHRFLYGEVDTPVAAVLAVFDVDRENSVPTWIAVMLLAVSAAILAVIASLKLRMEFRYRRHWVGLALIFAFLSLDESAALHERTRALFTDWLHLGGMFYFGWVILYAALVLVFAAVYLPFLLHLPPESRKLFAVAGVVYVAGALGAEMLGGQLLVTYGPGVQTGITVIAEEMLELTGVVIFIHALLVYLRGFQPEVTLAIAPAAAEPLAGAPVEGTRQSLLQEVRDPVAAGKAQLDGRAARLPN